MSPGQLIRFFLSELVKPLDNKCTLQHLFGVKNHTETTKLDICGINHIGKFAEPNVKPEDKILDLNYYKMEIEGIADQN